MRVYFLYTSMAALLAKSAYSQSYDVVIVGSGPGGLVAAEILTRQSDLSVLMLEAGPLSLQASGGTDSPAYAQSQGLTKFDIPGEFDLVAYNKENEQYRIDWIDTPYMWLGKLLGGCSSINAALYFRPADSYAQKASWPFSAAQITQGFQEIEKLFHWTETPSPDGAMYVQEAYNIVGQALQASGYEAKASLNAESARNAKDKTFGHPPYAIHDGLRDAPAKTLFPLLQQRANFKLLTQAKVQYVQQSQGAATGVVYESEGQSKVASLTSRGVVVMAAGALNTPAILMQSGIGPKQQLSKLAGIKDKFPGVQSTGEAAWVVNEHVGQHVFDTTVVYASFQHPQMKPFLNKKRPSDGITQYMTKNHTGPWATPGPVLIAYESRTLNGREFEMQTTVLPHGFGDFYETNNSFSAGFFLNNPLSRDGISFSDTGALKVATNKTWYGSQPDDVSVLSAYVESMVASFTKAGATFLNARPGQTTQAWVSSQLGSVTHHFGGSCYASSGSGTSCADANFKVVGTKNVYVSDASLMKEGTVNPYGFVMYIGNQAAKNVLSTAFQRTNTSSSANGEESGATAAPSTTSGAPTRLPGVLARTTMLLLAISVVLST